MCEPAAPGSAAAGRHLLRCRSSTTAPRCLHRGALHPRTRRLVQKMNLFMREPQAGSATLRFWWLALCGVLSCRPRRNFFRKRCERFWIASARSQGDQGLRRRRRTAFAVPAPEFAGQPPCGRTDFVGWISGIGWGRVEEFRTFPRCEHPNGF